MKKRNHMRLGAVLLCMLLLLCMIPAASTAANYAPCSHHTEHDGDCGGAADKCAYICEECVAEVQALVDKLPSMSEINADNSAAVGAQLAAIDAAKLGLSDAALDKVDFQKYEDAIFVLTVPPGWCSFAVSKSYYAVASGVETPTPEFAFLDENNEPAQIRDMYGTSAVSVEVEPDSGYRYIYLPEGTYTVSEEVEGDWLPSMSVNGIKDDDLTFTCEAGSGMTLLAFQNTIETPNIAVSYTDSKGNTSTPEPEDSVENAVAAVKEKLEDADPPSKANIDINSSTVSLSGKEVVLPKATTLTIKSGAKLTIEDESDLTISDGASVIIEDGASIDLSQNTSKDYYFWRDGDGKRIDISEPDGEQVTISEGKTTLSGVMTLSKGIDIEKDGGVLTLKPDTFDYNGEERKPTVTVTCEEKELLKDTDYKVEYSNNTNASSAEARATLPTVTVTGTGNYKGTLTATFTIEPIPLRVADVEIKDKMYDGGVTAEFENYGSIQGHIQGDEVSLNESGITAEFEDGLVGTDKLVKLSGYELTGADAGNYTLESPSTSAASITLTGNEETDKLIEEVMNVGEDDVTPDDEEKLREVKGALEEVVETDEDLTTAQEDAIEDEIDRIDTLLAVIDKMKEEDKKEPDIKSYHFRDDGLTWIKGGAEDMTFTVDAPADKFSQLVIDGKVVAPENYTYVSGSTVITLKTEYLNGLNPGSYEVVAEYTDGSAKTTLNVINSSTEENVDTGAETINSSAGENSDSNAETVKNSTGESSDTGDDSDMLPWLMVMMISMTAAAITVVARKCSKG